MRSTPLPHLYKKPCQQETCILNHNATTPCAEYIEIARGQRCNLVSNGEEVYVRIERQATLTSIRPSGSPAEHWPVRQPHLPWLALRKQLQREREITIPETLFHTHLHLAIYRTLCDCKRSFNPLLDSYLRVQGAAQLVRVRRLE